MADLTVAFLLDRLPGSPSLGHLASGVIEVESRTCQLDYTVGVTRGLLIHDPVLEEACEGSHESSSFHCHNPTEDRRPLPFI